MENHSHESVNFSGADFPAVSDSTTLSEILINNYHSEEEFASIFDDIKEGHIPSYEYNNRAKILSDTLPINFLYHITLERGTLGDASFFTPSQKFVMKYIQRTLYEMKDNESYQKVLEYFADQLMPHYFTNDKLFKFCGEVTIDKTKKIGILTYDNNVEIYSRDSLITPQQTLPITQLPKQSKLWEKIRSEIKTGMQSPLITVFRSFASLSSFETLPLEAYSDLINYITAPDLVIPRQILNKNLDDIELPLVTIFMHKNLHRRLLKYCIYHEVFSTDDPSHLMRMNSQGVKVVVVFLTTQISALIDPGINRIKEQICKAFNFDFTSRDEETIASFKKLTDIFIEGFINLLPVMSSSIRYACSIINEASKAKFKSLTFKGVFMTFFFRVIFPLICQPRETDPPGLKVDIKKMATFGKIMTSIFVCEQAQLSHFSEIAHQHEENVNKIFDRLTECNEPYDVIEQPSFKTTCLMVDRIRKKCQKKSSSFMNEPNRHSVFLMKWLDFLKNIDEIDE